MQLTLRISNLMRGKESWPIKIVNHDINHILYRALEFCHIR